MHAYIHTYLRLTCPARAASVRRTRSPSFSARVLAFWRTVILARGGGDDDCRVTDALRCRRD
ncbi:hypothetical protein HETIRDRAFT_439910 [Heterobasidion irregulare TC 32-1]|uniref:Uncharacterized protein n=1 Tax=Heterobasidion irregulare (strain TC 32-1) TaxID=747525 RepID=W4K7Z5_HETIT|nr:uncharacterized protein HETIRDRAFT_439910 [Heterobasidion irregulare TC 32-1]ETW81475.1 hypothetical protein HETIRDRAFT_439910 [Heterobasidion irregulare TC 32-1]